MTQEPPTGAGAAGGWPAPAGPPARDDAHGDPTAGAGGFPSDQARPQHDDTVPLPSDRNDTVELPPGPRSENQHEHATEPFPTWPGGGILPGQPLGPDDQGAEPEPQGPPPPPPPGAHEPLLGDPSRDASDEASRTTVIRRRRAGTRLLLVTCLALVSLLAGFAGGWLADRGTGSGTIELVTPDDEQQPARPPGSVAGVAAQVLPSVVSIETRFAQGQGTGSGFVMREDGYILTNNHVVDDAREQGEITVMFSDGSQEQAEVIGATSAYDLAVLRVGRTGLPALRLADSASLVVGDPVIAVGAPLGLESTVTTGIVSALNRPVAAGEGQDSAFINAIQTDAAINPGNSGGPLVDLKGDVVGINSAIARAPGNLGTTGGNIGLGFAIPGEQAARTAQQIIEEGRATYPVVGVLLDRSYSGEGVRVVPEDQDGSAAVTPGGPADEAGIRPGDVIVGFEGRPMTDPDQLIVAIRAQRPGDTVTMTVRSGGSERSVDVTLDESPAEEDS